MNYKDFPRISRRRFLQGSALGVAGLSLGPGFFVPGEAEPDALPSGFRFHPHMDPRRVAGLHDPSMTKEESPDAPWKVQDTLVRGDRVAENIDRLACALAEEKDSKAAWKKLILKPAAKEWNEAVVAIKTNNIALQHTRSAVLQKLCRMLIEDVGVKGGNVFIYDACHGGDMLKKTPFAGLPEDVHVAEAWGGFAKEAPVGKPWLDGKGKSTCLAPLAEGKVDILINVALCKGHAPSYGAFTLSMKNHFGTFNPRPHAHSPGQTDYLFAINRSPLILGDLDFRKNQAAYPRQQLCLVDALWASEQGPSCDSSCQPNRLFMGTFGPLTDYLVATEFRKDAMGWRIDEAVTGRFLSEFGFKAEDLPEGKRIIEVEAAS